MLPSVHARPQKHNIYFLVFRVCASRLSCVLSVVNVLNWPTGKEVGGVDTHVSVKAKALCIYSLLVGCDILNFRLSNIKIFERCGVLVVWLWS